jgi:hypothetical protein
LFAADISVAAAWKAVGEAVQRVLSLRAPPSLRAMQDRLAMLLDEYETGRPSGGPEALEHLEWLSKSRAAKYSRKILKQR